jgi:hypothetical protein
VRTPNNATSPAAPALTEQRLWFLYCVAGLLKSDIEAMTGWTRAQIDYRLRKWDLTMLSEAYWNAHFELGYRIAQALQISLEPGFGVNLREIRGGVRDVLRCRLLDGEVRWAAIDAFERPVYPACCDRR